MPIIRTFARNTARAKGLGTNSSVFRIVPSVNTVNEGSSVTFTITTQNFGTLQTQPVILGTYTAPGTYSYTVPSGVTSIQAIAIGGGGGGSSTAIDAGNPGQGGGGGGGAYRNNIPVTQGDVLSIVVGAGGAGAPVGGGTGTSGGASSVTLNGSVVLVRANGGIAGGLASYVPAGQVAFTTPGTYSWTAPAGVTSVSVVAVGGGGTGGTGSGAGPYPNGGGGGGLGWKNNITVVPGQTYQVVVGAAAQASYFINQSTVAGLGGGRPTGGGFVGDGGGNGGNSHPDDNGNANYGVSGGGGGAGGYTGNGGNAGAYSDIGTNNTNADFTTILAPTSGQGGGGGGGATVGSLYTSGVTGGGGVGLYGQGANGAAGGYTRGGLGGYPVAIGTAGGGGSGGADGTVTNGFPGGNGGNYGGGAGSGYGGNITNPGTPGTGAVRIIWAGSSGVIRAFPSTNTQDIVDTTAGVQAAGGAGIVGDVLGIGGRGGAGDGGTFSSRAGSGYYAAGGGGYHSAGSPSWGGSGGGGSGLNYPPLIFSSSQNARGVYDTGTGVQTIPGTGINGGSSGAQGNQAIGGPYSGTNNGGSGGAGGGYGGGGGGGTYNSAGGTGASGAVRISQIETVPTGTLYWTTLTQTGTINSSDFSDGITSGAVTINNNSGTLTRTLSNDVTTEGVESFALQLRADSVTGPIVAQSSDVTINDTSGTVTYNISTNDNARNEGQTATYTITTTNFGTGTLYWTTVTASGTVNASDFTDGVTSGSVSINNNSGTLTRTLSNDATTEGSEQYYLQLRTGSTSGPVVAQSDMVTISDTSVTPPYYAPYYPPYVPPYVAPYYPPAFALTVTYPNGSSIPNGWNINVPADGTGYNSTITVYCNSGSGNYQVQEISRPSAVTVAVDGDASNTGDGVAYQNYFISAGQTRSHTVTVYASPVGSGWSGAFAVVGPGTGTYPSYSWNWTAVFRNDAPYYPPYVPPPYVPPPYVPPSYNEAINHPSYVANGQAFNVYITGGMPNDSFGWSTGGGVYSGGGTLDSSGNYTFYNVVFPIGNWNVTWYFNGTGHWRYTYLSVYDPSGGG